ncbi:MFS transporter [Paraburkholderia sp. Ac-20340]|uniref:MFS transporter n=1 Tax=Paraburkholderia sp. Ac-20340 TaxID=2703888 RepID=UPI00197E5F25|nr:MFS transporter [Paraburkholderia sp. Ac-20340]MBN3854900.1 MFS transporter [Paraburkholderia sp. Ac-20340]
MNELHRPISDFGPDVAITASASAARFRPGRRAIVAAAIGNGLEMYDFTLYSFFAATIGNLFFPSSNALTSLLLSFGVFGAGFVMRPLGALLIGNIADQRGRKAALTLTIALMSIGTALIALTPSYGTIGITASVLVVIGRLLQGLSAGGEIGAASALLLESGGKERRCFLVSWQAATQGGAALLDALSGMTLSAGLSPEDLHAWGWRLPFLLGLLIAPIGLYMRRNLKETFEGNRKTALTGLREVFSENARTLILGVFLMASSTASMYVTVFYMPTYLVRTLHMPAVTAYAATCVSGLTLLALAPLFGRFADRLKRRKPLLICNSVLSMLIAIPNFTLLSSGPGLPLVAMCVAISGTLSALGTGAGTAMMMEALPREHRATGMSIMYSVGVTLFGGFAPLVVTWLINETGSRMAPLGYTYSAMIISFIAMLLYPSHPGRD